MCMYHRARDCECSAPLYLARIRSSTSPTSPSAPCSLRQFQAQPDPLPANIITPAPGDPISGYLTGIHRHPSGSEKHRDRDNNYLTRSCERIVHTILPNLHKRHICHQRAPSARAIQQRHVAITLESARPLRPWNVETPIPYMLMQSKKTSIATSPIPPTEYQRTTERWRIHARAARRLQPGAARERHSVVRRPDRTLPPLLPFLFQATNATAAQADRLLHRETAHRQEFHPRSRLHLKRAHARARVREPAFEAAAPAR